MAPCPFPRSGAFILLPPSLGSKGCLLVSWEQESYLSAPQGRCCISHFPFSAVEFCLSSGSYKVCSPSSGSLRLLLKGWKRSLQGCILLPSQLPVTPFTPAPSSGAFSVCCPAPSLPPAHQCGGMRKSLWVTVACAFLGCLLFQINTLAHA